MTPAPGRQAELARRGAFLERDVKQPALDPHRNVARLALQDRLAYVAPRVKRNAERQVAVHARTVGAAERALQIQHARKERVTGTLHLVGLPARLEAAGGVGVLQLEFVDVELDVLALHAPARLRRQLRERDARLLEHAGKLQRAILDRQAGVAAAGHGLELQRRALDAGNAFDRTAVPAWRRRPGADRQAGQPRLHAPVARRVQRAVPARHDAVDPALDRVRAQLLVQPGWQRQPAGDLGQRRQVEPVAAQLAAALAVTVVQREIAARPDQAVGIDELQVAGVELHRAGLVAPAEPAADGAEGQRRQLGPEARRHLVQRQVGGGADQRALAHLGPAAQRALAGVQVDVPIGLQIDVLAQPRHVDPGQIGEQLAVPLAPMAGMAREHRLPELPDQGEAPTPARRRRSVEPQLVAPAAIAHHQLHVMQADRRRTAPLVDPVDAAAAHQELGLREEPVGHAGITRGIARQVDAGHQQAAVGAAAHFQLGLVDHQLLQPAGGQR